MTPITIENEQEAAVAIILSCMLPQKRQQVTDAQFEQLAQLFIRNARFRGSSLEALSKKAMLLLATHDNKNVVAYAAPYITEEFRETVFAMICELMTIDGQLSGDDSQIVGWTALQLGISIELMQGMLSVFLIRNRWCIL